MTTLNFVKTNVELFNNFPKVESDFELVSNKFTTIHYLQVGNLLQFILETDALEDGSLVLLFDRNEETEVMKLIDFGVFDHAFNNQEFINPDRNYNISSKLMEKALLLIKCYLDSNIKINKVDTSINFKGEGSTVPQERLKVLLSHHEQLSHFYNAHIKGDKVIMTVGRDTIAEYDFKEGKLYEEFSFDEEQLQVVDYFFKKRLVKMIKDHIKNEFEELLNK